MTHKAACTVSVNLWYIDPKQYIINMLYPGSLISLWKYHASVFFNTVDSEIHISLRKCKVHSAELRIGLTYC